MNSSYGTVVKCPVTVVSRTGPLWHNPFLPSASRATSSRTVEVKDICRYFDLTGACRHGASCNRFHVVPPVADTLLFEHMFSNFGLEQTFLDEFDSDLGLEFDEPSLIDHLCDFFDDCIPEFERLGGLKRVFVSVNYAKHLRGNVYVQYDTCHSAATARDAFHKRWYDKKLLFPQYRSISVWSKSLCALFLKKRCTKGRLCNLIHVIIHRRLQYANVNEERIDSPTSKSSTSSSSSFSSSKTASKHSSRKLKRRGRESKHRAPSRHSDRTKSHKSQWDSDED